MLSHPLIISSGQGLSLNSELAVWVRLAEQWPPSQRPLALGLRVSDAMSGFSRDAREADSGPHA